MLSTFKFVFVLVTLFSPCLAQNSGVPNDKDFPSIVEHVKSSIGWIEVRTNLPKITSVGTGFLLDSNGVLSTCRHIFYDTTIIDGAICVPDTAQIWVTFYSHDRVYKASIVTESKDRDIALIRVGLTAVHYDSLFLSPLIPAAAKSTVEGVEVGCTGFDLAQKSTRFGNRYNWLTTHKAIISCVLVVGPTESEHFLDKFQIDAVVNKGVSGGPVYLAKTGEFVGMVKGFQGVESQGLISNFGLANCIPAWAIVRLYMNTFPKSSN